MDYLHEYQASFLDADGALIEEVAVVANSLSAASDCAGAIGTEMGAARFYLMPIPDENPPFIHESWATRLSS